MCKKTANYKCAKNLVELAANYKCAKKQNTSFEIKKNTELIYFREPIFNQQKKKRTNYSF